MLETLVRDTQDRRRQRRGLRARGVRPGVGAAAARKRDPLPRSARTQLRGVQFRQDLSRHRLESRLLPGAARADGRVPQGAPVHRVHRASPVATGAGRLHARAPGIRRRPCRLLPGQADFFREQLEGSRFELLPCAGTYFQLATYAAISDEPDTQLRPAPDQRIGVAAIPVSVFNPDGDDRRVIRFCFAKNEATLAAAGSACGRCRRRRQRRLFTCHGGVALTRAEGWYPTGAPPAPDTGLRFGADIKKARCFGIGLETSPIAGPEEETLQRFVA
jgi:hypothetical protein